MGANLLLTHSQRFLTVFHRFSMAQGKITNFFTKTTMMKRSASDSSETENKPKKAKLSNDENGKDATASNSISIGGEANLLSSPEVGEDRMARNCLAAKIKLQSKKTPALSPNIGLSWFKALQEEFSKPYFHKLSEFLETERKRYTVFPPADEIYTWTTLCDIHKIKVVLLGQDPYHNTDQAHGLSFSVKRGVPAPPSLVNIFKEVKSDLGNFEIPKHGDLTAWAKQGVLLLNACLTVRAHVANSHKDQGWELLTDAVIKWLNNNSNGIVFLLWGAYAQKKGSFINKKKHHVLTCAHPSPLSVHKGFSGCKHFSVTNQLLEKSGKKPIDWGEL